MSQISTSAVSVSTGQEEAHPVCATHTCHACWHTPCPHMPSQACHHTSTWWAQLHAAHTRAWACSQCPGLKSAGSAHGGTLGPGAGALAGGRGSFLPFQVGMIPSRCPSDHPRPPPGWPLSPPALTLCTAPSPQAFALTQSVQPGGRGSRAADSSHSPTPAERKVGLALRFPPKGRSRLPSQGMPGLPNPPPPWHAPNR